MAPLQGIHAMLQGAHLGAPGSLPTYIFVIWRALAFVV